MKSHHQSDLILDPWKPEAVRAFDKALRENPLLYSSDVSIVVSEKRGEVRPVLYFELRRIMGSRASDLDALHEEDGFLLSVKTDKSIVTRLVAPEEISFYRNQANIS